MLLCLLPMFEVIQNLCNFIKEKVENEKINRNYVLYLARICQALTSESLSSDIKKTLTFDKLVNDNSHNNSAFNAASQHLSSGATFSSRYRKSSVSKQPQYEESRKILRKTSNLALNKWIKLSTLNLKDAYFKNLLNHLQNKNLTNICTWVDLDGQGLKIPNQASISLHQLLGRTCNLLNKSEAHAFKKSIIANICNVISDEILGAYNKLVADWETLHKMHNTSETAIGQTTTEANQELKISQYFAVQQLFDIKFLKLIFNQKDQKFLQIEDFLAKFIDPFDYDIICQHLDKYISRALSRVSIMYGVINQNKLNLNAINKQNLSNLGPGQEVHSVLELNASSAASVDGAKRIQPLPISIDIQMFLKNTKTQNRLPDRLKSQLTFGNIYDTNRNNENNDSGLTSKLFGMFM